ncbi:beta-propeller fold lactonase family protein [Jatrophihabitans telluris]|uniref:Beta-propeller fold lactonase family protein n=1 Tax=Jatrophihabitans telluris TaxID=2038343 RepID=A0ABY4R1X0_9ACTN|nr:beta-propeller fold lactonase family protein [Jatrophihabitans telluris]UQX89271.1 beta-propeller fold lactonase family protein [Jatrophihabitans telluris]
MYNRLALPACGIMLAAGAGLAVSLPASATADPSHASRVVGHAYIDGNTAGANTVAAFDRHADGSLTEIAGSPFAVGGSGLGTGLGSQGAIQTSPDHRFLLAVDAGSNEISVLKVGHGGALRLVGSPVPSGGVEPVSIAINGDGLVYVANVGAGGSNYTGFRLSNKGHLIPLPNTTVAVPDGSGVGDVLFNSTGDRLIGTRDNPSLIDSFTVRPDGRLVPAAGSPFPAQSLGPIGAEFRPTNPNQLYVSNAHAGAGNGTVSAFSVSRHGVLTPIGDSPVADFQTAPCWVEISHDGKYLFAINTGSTNLSTYAILSDGSLSLLGSTAFTNGVGAVDARLSPDGRFLSVTGGRGHVVSTFAVDGGTLTELPSSPVALPASGAPTGLAVI